MANIYILFDLGQPTLGDNGRLQVSGRLEPIWALTLINWVSFGEAFEHVFHRQIGQ